LDFQGGETKVIQEHSQSRLETRLYNLFKEHSRELRLFFILLLVNIFIYGQKLFFYAFPADDYMRFFGDTNPNMLITNSARWAQALLNEYVFVGKLQILPYLHGLVGIFSFTLMGYLSAKYLQRERVSEIVLITLCISVSPMFAHNLYFSTNITTWLALLLGLLGFFAAHKRGILPKALGLFLMVFSIGNYQSIIQIVLLLALFKMLLTVGKAQEFTVVRKAVLSFIGWTVWLGVAYIVSFYINEAFLHYYHLHEAHRLAKADSGLTFSVLLQRVRYIYTHWFPFNFFEKEFNFLYLFIFFLSVVSLFVKLAVEKSGLFLKLLKFFLFIGAFTSVVLIVKLPSLMGVDIPIRAYFPVGWALAGLAVLQFEFFRGWLRNVTLLSLLVLMVLNVYYITLFFDSCKRQTDADIRRANMIVERIRISDGYVNEPIAFRIEGYKKFNVPGWKMQWQQPFNSFWSKYPFFRDFTDMRFYIMKSKEYQEIIDYLIKKGEFIQSYPGKNSIVVYKNKAVVFLNADKINILIKKSENLKKIPLEREPDIHSVFDLYVKNNMLFYYKKECNENDIRKKFFLRIYPKDPQNTVIHGKRGIPFQTWDFYFSLYGKKTGDVCVAAVELPKQYEIGKIRTGQFGDKKLDWDVSYHFPNKPNEGEKK